ncbi:MAG: hypothetical protein J5379_00715 [Clostridiales bacterium]|nr:hypothetical protein [Clostridiales bacterium]
MLNTIFRVIGLLFIVYAIYLIAKKSIHTGTTAVQGVKKDPPLKKKNLFILFGIGILCILFSLSFTIIPTGYTGVRVTFGQVEQRTLNNGINFQLPLIQEIVLVNNKQQDIKFNDNAISSETSERNTVNFQGITVTYQINPQKSAWIYANVTNYEAGLVSESLVASAIKTTSKTLSPNDCTNRSIIEPKAKENIQKSLDEKYGTEVVYVNKVVINDASFDAEYDEKIAKKQQAQIDYETQQIENKKNIEKAEADAAVTKTNAQAAADAKVIAAQADADANTIISNSIDENVLRNKYYETWDGKLPTTIVGSDATASILIDPMSSGNSTEKAGNTSSDNNGSANVNNSAANNTAGDAAAS